MKRILLTALMVFVSVPAFAAPDADIAKGMVQCSVLFADEARLAREHNSPDNEKMFNSASTGFMVAAAAYTPGEQQVAMATVDGWKTEYAATVSSLSAEAAKAKYLECETLEPMVTDVVQAIKAQQGAQEGPK